MIAPDFRLIESACFAPSDEGLVEPSPLLLPSGHAMNLPWFQLCLNFVLLGAAVFICNTINASQREAKWNGALIFVGLCALAMVLDLLLTRVFASAASLDRMGYVSLASMPALGERVIGYAIPCVVGVVLAVRFRQRRNRRVGPVRIQTSEYTQSELSA
jgi:hypothetical protein